MCVQRVDNQQHIKLLIMSFRRLRAKIKTHDGWGLFVFYNGFAILFIEIQIIIGASECCRQLAEEILSTRLMSVTAINYNIFVNMYKVCSYSDPVEIWR